MNPQEYALLALIGQGVAHLLRVSEPDSYGAQIALKIAKTIIDLGEKKAQVERINKEKHRD